MGNHLVGHWFRSISFLFVWSSAWECFSLLSPSAIAVKVKPNPRPWQNQWSWVSGFLVGLFGIHTRKRLCDFPEKESCSNHFFRLSFFAFLTSQALSYALPHSSASDAYWFKLSTYLSLQKTLPHYISAKLIYRLKFLIWENKTEQWLLAGLELTTCPVPFSTVMKMQRLLCILETCGFAF